LPSIQFDQCIDSGRPGPRPSGALRASRCVPDESVNRSATSPVHCRRSNLTSALTRAVLALALRARCARPDSFRTNRSTALPPLR